ncbi:FG-GAP-like repeat-containing protein [Blastococcus litoris]|uniref:FG-GAP-like repeat-containing protein n=1 Tax=Blastococcus litoris TaxID=2171622 RepID=UPI000E30979A|nr:FG-GAP-like repeat-containing protein [Blastococcus litoris]
MAASQGIVGRSTRRVLAVLALALLVSAGGPWAATPAGAATMYGHDISWPQCPTSGGGGLPLPPADTQFVIVGLTRGLPFTVNPCLQSQVDWVRANAKPAHAYTIAAFPTAQQLDTYGTQGPWSATTRAGRLANVGYAEAVAARASLTSTSFAPPVVWIDVEPRSAQPWPTGTRALERENRLVLEGVMRGLRDGGIPFGLYSYTNAWTSITGSWWLPGVPVWATAGRLDYPTEAQDRCTQPSFSGGRVYVSQWYDDVRDYDLTCGTYAFTPLPMPPSVAPETSDFDGDGGGDVLARDRATGALWLYGRDPTAPGVTWRAPRQVGNGWQTIDALDTVGDFDGNGTVDVLARWTSTGELWLYPGDGTGGWLAPARVGVGWNGMNALVGPGDFDGNQRVDLLAREGSTGELWLYPGNGTGGWLPRVRVGSGWNVMNALVAPGDFTGDGTADLLARETSSGDLWLYPGNGTGGWLPRVRVGSGWNVMNALVAPGDFTGDGTADLLARETSTGELWLYPGNGTGGWLPRVRVGFGWNGMDAIV